MDFNELTDEQREALRAAKTPDELRDAAREMGYELTNAELDAVSGGQINTCTLDTCTLKDKPCWSVSC